jgi:hypothetical protein
MDRMPPQEIEESSLLEKDGIGKLNLFTTLANNPELLELYRTVGGELRDRARLDDRTRGMIILTVARSMDVSYIWHQHVEEGLAAANGISEAEIESIRRESYEDLDAGIADLLSFVRAYVVDSVSDDQWRAVRQRWSRAELVEAMFLASYYEMTGKFMRTMEIPIEE